MRRNTAYPDKVAPGAAPDLKGALCAGILDFTEGDHLDRPTLAALLRICQRCPVLEACAADRDRWRAAEPFAWAGFSGVWGGRAYVRGRPSRRLLA